jgi:hypothetical protein
MNGEGDDCRPGQGLNAARARRQCVFVVERRAIGSSDLSQLLEHSGDVDSDRRKVAGDDLSVARLARERLDRTVQ